MTKYNREWRRFPRAVDDYLQRLRADRTDIGGRFFVLSESEEDRMFSVLYNEGLELVDSGQCEVVGVLHTAPTGIVKLAVGWPGLGIFVERWHVETLP